MPKHPAPIAAAFVAVTLLWGGPAASQTTSPDAMTAARELVVTMRGADQFTAILPMIMQQLRPAIVQGRPDVGRDFDAMLPMLQELIGPQSDALVKLLEDIAAIYARNFTADELRQVAGFYRQPVGQKFLDRMPAIMQDSMGVGQKFGQVIAAELQKRVIEELRKRGHKI